MDRKCSVAYISAILTLIVIGHLLAFLCRLAASFVWPNSLYFKMATHGSKLDVVNKLFHCLTFSCFVKFSQCTAPIHSEQLKFYTKHVI